MADFLSRVIVPNSEIGLEENPGKMCTNEAVNYLHREKSQAFRDFFHRIQRERLG